ncbi:MAG: recombinase family protein [Defluviitaleaceae bacterium]|nr:recombinase family protein [Defluviitaleaceae bacterium]MCL2263619.1 recombinase family protein [Defluviitaleaceae bacterium]
MKVCYNYAKSNNITILREYIDRAQSGKTDDRAELQKMLLDSKKKQFQAVIVYALDRFGRNLHQSVANEHRLEKNGVKLMSATENFSDDPAGRLNRNMMMSFAQYYSDELAQKIARGHGINADNCYSNGSPVPLGYKLERIDPANEKSKKKFVVNEETAPIVKEIFTKYASGVSVKEIYTDLNARQIRTSSGAKFNKNSMNGMLQNKKYIGYYVYGKVEKKDCFPRIIDDDLFDRVADKMKLNKALPARSRAIDEYLLTSKLYCGHCNTMMIGHSSNKKGKNGVKYNYYKCKKQGKNLPCKKKMVHKSYIEDIVINKCREMLDLDIIRWIAKEIARIAESYDDTTEIDRLKKLLHEAQRAKENHMVSLRKCADDTVREMIVEDLSALGAEIKALEKQLALEQARRETISEKQIIESLTRLAKGDINKIETRRALIRLLVNKIFLYDDRYTITFNSGDDEVEITNELLSNIEKGLEEKFCLSAAMVQNLYEIILQKRDKQLIFNGLSLFRFSRTDKT